MIYLDHNATTRPAPEALQEMLDVLTHAWANPSSTHEPGQAARRILSDARTRVAAALGCAGNELVFTSGATESNHMAVLGGLHAGRPQGRWRVVMSAVEHPGLIALGQRLKEEGGSLSLIPVTPSGELDLAAAERLIGPDVALVSVMGANNETWRGPRGRCSMWTRPSWWANRRCALPTALRTSGRSRPTSCTGRRGSGPC
jgi:cysteine desulfurase